MMLKLALCALVWFLENTSQPAPKPAPPKATAQPASPSKPAKARAQPVAQAKESQSALESKPAQPAPASTPPKVTLIAIEKNIVEYTNAERARYGLPALEVDSELVESARAHCTWMTLNQRLQHTRAAVAENIAMGQRDSQEVLGSWMRSSGHRANILNSAHRAIGVAAFRTPSGTIFWCQQFR